MNQLSQWLNYGQRRSERVLMHPEGVAKLIAAILVKEKGLKRARIEARVLYMGERYWTTMSVPDIHGVDKDTMQSLEAVWDAVALSRSGRQAFLNVIKKMTRGDDNDLRLSALAWLHSKGWTIKNDTS